MKDFISQNQAVPIASLHKSDGTSWSIREKFWLGLSVKEYREQFLRNPVNWVLILILAVGVPLLFQRYLFGLHTVTHASNDYPWGLFLGFGLFALVPLSASGFLMGMMVEILGRKDFVPIERLALLNGLIGYIFAIVYLLVDLGMPWRLYVPMTISFGPAAVLFLVAWHFACYLAVQLAEVSTAFFEWIGWLKGKRFIKSIVIGLTIAGIMLSILHQGGLGALFNYTPNKLHPLWFSAEYSWIQFFCSAIYGGLGMIIITSTLCKNYMAWRCDTRFLDNLDELTLAVGKGASYALFTYLIIKLIGVAHDNKWLYLLTGWGQYFLLELVAGAFLPMMMFAVGVKNRRVGLVRVAGWVSVLGLVWNRINTSMIAFNWQLYAEIPHWKEVWITVAVFALYFIVYRFILYRLPILYEWQGEK